MIAAAELVLDDHDPAVFVLAPQIHPEATGSHLTFQLHELDACCITQDIRVLLEPSSEVVLLMPPHLPEGNALKLADAASCNLDGHSIFSIQAAADGHVHV